MNKKFILSISLALGWTLPAPVYALGLGPLIVLSAPGEPLRAEIPIQTSHPEELSTLSAQLARPSAYAMIHLPIMPASQQWSFSVRKGSKPAILISGPAPIGTKPIPFLAQLDWANGQLIREYQAAQVSTSPSLSTPRTTDGAVALSPPKRESATADWTTIRQFGPVPKGVSLFDIAKQINSDPQISQQQAMFAIFRANPRAFLAGDPDQLAAGAILRIPSKNQVLSISPLAAASFLRRREATKPATPTPAGNNNPSFPAAAVPTPAGQTLSSAATTSGKGQIAAAFSLTSTPTPSTSSAATANSAADQHLEELEKLGNRVKSLEAQLRLQQSQLSLQEVTTRHLSRGSRDPLSPPVILSLALNMLLLMLFTWIYRRQRQNAKREEEIAAKIERLQIQENQRSGSLASTDSRPTTVADFGKADTSETAHLASVSPPQVERESPAALGATPKASTRPVPQRIVSSAVPLSSQSMSSQVRESELLEKELDAHPNRRDLFVKLLECYAKENDSTKFLDLAERMRSRFGPMNKDWRHIALLGRELFPENPLFAGEVTHEATSTPLEESATSAPLEKRFEEPDFLDFDFSKLGEPTVPAASSSAETSAEHSTNDNESLDWLHPLVEAFGSLDGQDKTSKANALRAEPEPQPVSGNTETTLEFPELSLTDQITTDSSAQTSPESGAADFVWDSIGTKLDLAKAYLELGDKDAALDLLHEIQKEGNVAQREEAGQLIFSAAH